MSRPRPKGDDGDTGNAELKMILKRTHGGQFTLKVSKEARKAQVKVLPKSVGNRKCKEAERASLL